MGNTRNSLTRSAVQHVCALHTFSFCCSAHVDDRCAFSWVTWVRLGNSQLEYKEAKPYIPGATYIPVGTTHPADDGRTGISLGAEGQRDVNSFRTAAGRKRGGTSGSLWVGAWLLLHWLPGHSEKLAGGAFPFGRAVLSLTPSPWLPASGQPRRRASSTPPTLLHPSLTAGRSRLTRRRAAAPTRRIVPRRAAPLQRGCQRVSERSPG